MGNGQVSRYIGGKVPYKYYKEDLWPDAKEYLRKLSIDESRGYELFKIFCKIDTDQSATLDVEECMEYFGGKRTRFTERIFDTIDLPEDKEGLSFVEFALTMWNFCTLNTAGLARYVYEIFDVDMNGYIEGADIAAIYRMMYDVDEDDTKMVSKFPLNDGKVTKDNFIKYIKSKKDLIRPAIDYQSRLRKYLGGVIMWEQLVGYRKRYFSVYDQKSTTLERSFIAILNSPDPHKTEKPLTATEKLLLEQERIKTAASEARKQLIEFERIRAEEKKRAESNQEDRAMSLAWMAVEAKKQNFENMEFTTSNIMDRQDERAELFELFDKAVDITKQYWIEKYRKQDYQALGTEADITTRIDDYLKTEVGKKDFERVQLIHILTATKDRISALQSNSQKGKDDIQQISNQIAYLEKGNLNTDGAVKMKNKFAKKIDSANIKEKTDEAFRQNVIEKYQIEMDASRAEEIEEREKDFKRKEFAIATALGSRHTRWETVYDTQLEKMVTINIDTLRVLNDRACICELCDKTIEQNDANCFHCKAPRSAKNRHLYKPLGAL